MKLVCMQRKGSSSTRAISSQKTCSIYLFMELSDSLIERSRATVLVFFS